jgi:hypothetical protein
MTWSRPSWCYLGCIVCLAVSTTVLGAELSSSVEDWLCECGTVAATDSNIYPYSEVTAYPGIPGCTVQDGRIRVKNTSSLISFRLNYEATFENQPPGQASCDGCGTSDPCCKNNCDDCDWCDGCASATGKEVGPGQNSPAPGVALPDCDRDCDNQFCVGGDNNEKHCIVDSDCPGGGSCEPALGGAGSQCPTCGVNAYHCTDVQDVCSGGANDGEGCDCDSGCTRDCPNGQCVEDGSVIVEVTAFKCTGDANWTEKVCEGGANAGVACAAAQDCPNGQCVPISLIWSGNVIHAATPLGGERTCPAQACQ